jgi:hypothetical protein
MHKPSYVLGKNLTKKSTKQGVFSNAACYDFKHDMFSWSTRHV